MIHLVEAADVHCVCAVSHCFLVYKCCRHQPHCTAEETEARGGNVTYSRSLYPSRESLAVSRGPLTRPESLPRPPLGRPLAAHFSCAWTALVSGAPACSSPALGPGHGVGKEVSVPIPCFLCLPLPEPGNLMKRRELSAAPSAVCPPAGGRDTWRLELSQDSPAPDVFRAPPARLQPPGLPPPQPCPMDSASRPDFQ